jgi:SAM-dependent methyltransferase
MQTTRVSRHYTEAFYETAPEASRTSSGTIASLVCEYVNVGSVVDLGCGPGHWLAAFRAQGITDIQGVEGAWVDPAQMQVPPDTVMTADLSQPFRLDRSFDLAMSLEVAEHLPATSAATFVESLVSLAPVVLFSAAIPQQGGTFHINEQWPDYWAHLFAAHDYVAIDAIRQQVWNDPKVLWYYAQNTLLYVRRDMLTQYPQLQHVYAQTGPAVRRLVHPENYQNRSVRIHLSRLRACLSMRLRERLHTAPRHS